MVRRIEIYGGTMCVSVGAWMLSPGVGLISLGALLLLPTLVRLVKGTNG